jgi:hypothetical protein
MQPLVVVLQWRGAAMNRISSWILVCAIWSFAPPVAAATDDRVVKFACDTELKIYKGDLPGSYPLRGIYVEISGQRVRVVGTSGFDGTYEILETDERMTYLRDPSDLLLEGNLNRINGDLWLAKWSDANKSSMQRSVSGQCRPYKPLF